MQPPSIHSQPASLWLALTALPAAAAPVLLAYNQPPSPTLLNQCVAVVLWGWFLVALRPALRATGCAALLWALGLVALGVAASWWPGDLPAAMALSALALLAAAAAMVAAGHDAGTRADAGRLFGWFATGLLLAGLASSLVAFVQVFLPDWADGDWIARSGLAGRAVGNLRQPNHLSSLLLWAMIAAVALNQLGWLRRAAFVVAMVLLLGAVVLTGSRTGIAGVVLFVLWGLVDRRLMPWARVALLVSLPLYFLGLWALGHAGEGGSAIGLAARQGGDVSASRFGIWANTLALIAQHPWRGVGFGEFNLAWTMTEFPGRPVAFFDHSHNLPLQMLAELGLPLGGAALALLAVALWQAARRSSERRDAAAAPARCALLLVLMIGVHSLFEYPLWYAYFLLPAAFAFGFALARPAGEPQGATLDAAERPPVEAPVDSTRRAPQQRHASSHAGVHGGMLAGTMLVAGGTAAVFDYRSVVVIFSPPAHATSLESRIERGQRSLLFDHHADYAAATAGGGNLALALQRAPHHLLDARLMIAWAQALAAAGRTDEARWIAARLREFRNPDAQDFLGVCSSDASDLPFQCQPPQRRHHWRDLIRSPRP